MSGEPSVDELIEQLKNVRIQETRIIEQIERASRREAPIRTDTTRCSIGGIGLPPTSFRIGDRVRVTNGVKAGQVPTGVITKVSATRINILTDNGIPIWRARKNVALL